VVAHLLALHRRVHQQELPSSYLGVRLRVQEGAEHRNDEAIYLGHREDAVDFGEKEAMILGADDHDRPLRSQPDRKEPSQLLVARQNTST
jgi:hypothetical protein